MSSCKSVHMIILLQSDIAQAIDFYKKLGLKFVFSVPETWAEFMLDGVKIGLCKSSQDLQGERHSGFVIEVDNIQQWYTEYKEIIPIVQGPMEKPHGIMISIKDPGGNIIDFYQPTPEKLASFIQNQKVQEHLKDTGVQQEAAHCVCGKQQVCNC